MGTQGGPLIDHVMLLNLNIGYMTVSVCENISSCILMICAVLCVYTPYFNEDILNEMAERSH